MNEISDNRFGNFTEIDDPFYQWDLKSDARPGQLLKIEPFSMTTLNNVKSWRTLYVSELRETPTPQLVVTSGYVIAPDFAASSAAGSTSVSPTVSATSPASYSATDSASVSTANSDTDPAPDSATAPKSKTSKLSPVIAWSHGTTGFLPYCAPTFVGESCMLFGIPDPQKILNQNWTIVGTDYPGMGAAGINPYLVGPDEGRAMLNAIKAAHQIEQLNLSTETVFWGHSQGGHSALWSGILAPKYYPKLSVKGIAAAAPATDLAALFGAADLFNPSRTFLAYIVAAYSLIYPDVIWSDLVVTPEPEAPTFQALKVCVAGQPHADLPDPILKPDYINTAFGERLKQNTPLFPIPAPILIGQGVQDKSVPLNMQEHFVQQFNAVIHAQAHSDSTKSNASHRPKLEFRVYPEEDHISLVTNPNNTFASDLFNFTKSLLN